MLGLLKYRDDFSKAQGLILLWYKDTSETVAKLIIMDLLQGMHISSNLDNGGDIRICIESPEDQ